MRGRRMGADSLWNAVVFQACCKRGLSCNMEPVMWDMRWPGVEGDKGFVVQ